MKSNVQWDLTLTINVPVGCPGKTSSISAHGHHINNTERTRSHHLEESAGGQINNFYLGEIRDRYLDSPSLHFLQTCDSDFEFPGVSNRLCLFQGIYEKLVNRISVQVKM